MKVYDNFLSYNEFKKIQDDLYSLNFPWYYSEGVVAKDDNYDQFFHFFYSHHMPRSEYIETIDPIVFRLKAVGLIRIKANLLTRTPTIIEHGMHIDIENNKKQSSYDGKTAIYYVNTNNGYTKFEDGTVVNSVENRCVVFDSSLRHTGTTCTDQKTRVVINFCYVEGNFD
jgi:YHS domain-containing protein